MYQGQMGLDLSFLPTAGQLLNYAEQGVASGMATQAATNPTVVNAGIAASGSAFGAGLFASIQKHPYMIGGGVLLAGGLLAWLIFRK